MGTIAVAVTALLAVAFADQSRAAETNWHGGQLEMAYDFGCLGYPHVVMAASAAWYQDEPPKLPQVGDVFYARTRAAAVGSPCIEGPQLVGIEMTLPVGLEMAISDATPVRCASYDIQAMTETPITPAEGCPQRPAVPTVSGYGVRFDNTAGPDAPFFPVAEGKGIIVMVPVRATRRMLGTSEPTCPGGVCSPSEAGDNVQFGIVLAHSGDMLAPHVGMFVEPYETGSLASFPGSSRIASFLSRGLPVSVKLTRAAARVTVEITGRGPRSRRTVTLARVTRRKLAAGSYRLRLKPTRKKATALAEMRAQKATLKLIISSPGRDRFVATGVLKLRR